MAEKIRETKEIDMLSDKITPEVSAFLLPQICGNHVLSCVNKQVPNCCGDDLKKRFLWQLGLVDLETASLMAQELNNIRALHKTRIDALFQEMLKMKPKYYLSENGKLMFVSNFQKPTQTLMVQSSSKKNVTRKRSASETRGVYFCLRSKLGSSKAEKDSRSHLSRKATTGLAGLSDRSKKLLGLCRDFSIQVHLMSDSQVAYKIQETRIAGKMLQSTERSSSTRKTDSSLGISHRSKKLLASCPKLSIRVQRMSDDDVEQKIREIKNLETQLELPDGFYSSSSLVDQNQNASSTSMKKCVCEDLGHSFTIDVYRITEEEIQNKIGKKP